MTLKPNGVVNEQSSQDGIDVHAQQNADLQHLLGMTQHEQQTPAHVQTERVEIRSGNAMIDQFAPWYFGLAFVLFIYAQRRDA